MNKKEALLRKQALKAALKLQEHCNYIDDKYRDCRKCVFFIDSIQSGCTLEMVPIAYSDDYIKEALDEQKTTP